MKKALAFVSALLFVVSLVGLWAGGQQEGGRTGKDVTITQVTHAAGWLPGFTQLAEEWNAADNPFKVKVELVPYGEYDQKMQVMLSSGNAPDIFWLNREGFMFYAEGGKLLPLDGYIERDNYDLDQFFPQAVDELVVGGKMLAMPMVYHSGYAGLFYLKDAFDEEGLEYPNENWTYEDQYLKAAKALTKDTDGDGKIDQFGSTFGTALWGQIQVMIFSYGGRILNDDGTEAVLGDKATRAIGFMRDLALIHKVVPPLNSEVAFRNGIVGMEPGGYWNIGDNLKQLDKEWDAAPLPKGPAGSVAAWGAGALFCVPENAEYPDQAWEYIKYLLTDERERFYMEQGYNPSSKPEIAEEFRDQKGLAPFIDALYDHRRAILPHNYRQNEMKRAIQSSFELIISGEMGLEEGMEKMRKDLNTVLKRPAP